MKYYVSKAAAVLYLMAVLFSKTFEDDVQLMNVWGNVMVFLTR